MPEIQVKDNPNLMSFLRRITEIGLTGLVWGLWIYLLLPIINLLLWIFGVRHVYHEVFENLGYLELFVLIQKIGWVIIVSFIVFRLWGYYNYWRFGRRNKRRSVGVSNIEDFARHFNIDVRKVESLMSQKEILWPPKELYQGSSD